MHTRFTVCKWLPACGAALLALAGCGGVTPFRSAGPSQNRVTQEAASPGQQFLRMYADGRNLEQTGEWDEAGKVYERMIKQFPDRGEPNHRLAVVYDKQRRHRDAQELYAKAIRLTPPNGELFNDLGYSLYLDGELAKAESAMLKAVALSPESPRFRNNLGMVLGQQNRVEEAFAQFREAGSDADAHYNLAFVYASQDNSDSAIQHFQLALASDPGHQAAARALKSFQEYSDVPWDRDTEAIVSDGRRFVPFVEGAESRVQPASAGMSNARSSKVRQALHSQAVQHQQSP